MNSITTTISALLLLFIAGTTHGQSASMNLAEAQDYAVKNAFKVKTAKADEQSAALTTDELIGYGLPQVNASVEYQNYINLPTSLVPAEFFGGEPGSFAKLQFGTPHNTTVGLSATQLLFDGSWLVGLEAAKSYASLQKKQVQKSEIEVKNDVAKSYHLAVISTKNLALIRESREVLARMVDETKELLKNGFAEEQDVQQLQLSLNELDNRLAHAEHQEKITYDLLKFNMGMPLITELTLTENADNLVESARATGTGDGFSADANIDVQLVQGGLAMQQLGLKNQRSKLLPQAGAFYNLQTQAQRNKFNFFDTSEPWFPVQLWGVRITVPVFSGMSKTKNIQKAKVEVQRMTDMLSMTREAALLEYNSAKTDMEYAGKNLRSTQDNLDLAEEILRKTNIRFKEGLATSFEVSQNTNQILVAQGNYIQAMFQLLEAETRLKKALNR